MSLHNEEPDFIYGSLHSLKVCRFVADRWCDFPQLTILNGCMENNYKILPPGVLLHWALFGEIAPLTLFKETDAKSLGTSTVTLALNQAINFEKYVAPLIYKLLPEVGVAKSSAESLRFSHTIFTGNIGFKNEELRKYLPGDALMPLGKTFLLWKEITLVSDINFDCKLLLDEPSFKELKNKTDIDYTVKEVEVEEEKHKLYLISDNAIKNLLAGGK